jgi:hypothetical protein
LKDGREKMKKEEGKEVGEGEEWVESKEAGCC